MSELTKEELIETNKLYKEHIEKINNKIKKAHEAINKTAYYLMQQKHNDAYQALQDYIGLDSWV